MTGREEKAGFAIDGAPAGIAFARPHCRRRTGAPFEDVDEPECRQDDRGSAERPHCGGEAESGERSHG